jgi:hypothetical protein
VTAQIEVRELSTDQLLLQTEVTVAANVTLSIATLPEIKGGFYKLTWGGDAVGVNHFTASIADTLNFSAYLSHMKACGFDRDLCGFEA